MIAFWAQRRGGCGSPSQAFKLPPRAFLRPPGRWSGSFATSNLKLLSIPRAITPAGAKAILGPESVFNYIHSRGQSGRNIDRTVRMQYTSQPVLPTPIRSAQAVVDSGLR